MHRRSLRGPHRTTVNDSMTETLGARTDHLSDQGSHKVIERFDPDTHALTSLPDWQSN